MISPTKRPNVEAAGYKDALNELASNKAQSQPFLSRFAADMQYMTVM